MYKGKSLSNLKLFPFNADDPNYYYSGRNALWHAMKVLRFSSNSEILVPSYNCGAEIDPLFKWGVAVKLYRIDSRLKIDLDDLRKKINKNTKAVLVTHYFGFPQPVNQIRTICDENNMFFIEDCAYATFSNYKDKPLGCFGDISIFSHRKILPIPDGGILIVNNKNLKHVERPINPPLMYELNNFTYQLSHGIKSKAPLMLIKLVSKISKKANSNNVSSLMKNKSPFKLHGYHLNMDKANWGMSKVSMFLIKKMIKSGDMEVIIEKVQQNFNFLLHKLKGLNSDVILFDELPRGVCPSLFPIVVNERDRIYEELLKRGIFTLKYWQFFYPDLPWNLFPEAVFLKKHILSFPIHYCSDKEYLLRVIKALKEVV